MNRGTVFILGGLIFAISRIAWVVIVCLAIAVRVNDYREARVDSKRKTKNRGMTFIHGPR